MRKKRLITVLAAVLILALGVGVGVYAASNFGTQSDPLVAKSYLDNVLTPKLKEEYSAQLGKEFAVLDTKISNVAATAKGNFSAVTLTSGQTLTTSAGCEIILRSGTALASGSLTDVTDGAALSSSDSLPANHLCITGTDSSGVYASGDVILLVKGSYSITQ